MKNNSAKKHNWLGFFANIVTILGITGITLIQVFYAVGNLLPYVRIEKEERVVEQVKVSQTYEYVESILGKPYINNLYEFPPNTYIDEEKIVGRKVVFGAEFYTIITYFDDDDTLFGYFLISKDKSFSPKQFRGSVVFGKTLSDYTSSHFDGILTAISSSCAYRPDSSSHFMKYYYHHLTTNDCLVGIGISSFNCNDYFPVETSKTGKGFVFLGDWDDEWNFIDYDSYRNTYSEIDNSKSNTFSVFIANGKINPIKFLEEETYLKLALTELELNRLTY